MTARPLTRLEWQRMRFGAAYPNAHDSQAHVAFDAAGADRIEATIEAGGFQPDPPTPYELDEWAARLMGWTLSAGAWVQTTESLAGTTKIIDRRDWQPSQDLGQALECMFAANLVFSIHGDRQGCAVVRTYPGPKDKYDRPYDEAEVAEAIMRHVHAEVAND